MNRKYKYGELLISDKPTVVETLSGTKEVPAGNKVVIGFDGLAHHLSTDMIQAIQSKPEGFSNTGIVEAIISYLDFSLCISEILEEYDLTLDTFREELTEALEQIGLYE